MLKHTSRTKARTASPGRAAVERPRFRGRTAAPPPKPAPPAVEPVQAAVREVRRGPAPTTTAPTQPKTPVTARLVRRTVEGQNTKPAAPRVKGTQQYVRPEVLPFMLKALEAVDEVNIAGKTLAEAGAAVPSTIANWRNFRTRSPQMVTILGTLRACGKDLEVVDRKR